MSTGDSFTPWVQAMLPFVTASLLYSCTTDHIHRGDHEAALRAIESHVNTHIRATENVSSGKGDRSVPTEEEVQALVVFLRQVIEQIRENDSRFRGRHS